jgi:lipoyl(octanoyl) transferase
MKEVKRLPRDVSVHLFRREPSGLRFLMLRRIPSRGGFWQGVTGAPLPGETDPQAAVREVREETGFDVTAELIDLDVRYSYALRREMGDQVYGPGVEFISVASFAAEIDSGQDPVVDPSEHDSWDWLSFEEANAFLDWPIEEDALAGRREALRVLASR